MLLDVMLHPRYEVHRFWFWVVAVTTALCLIAMCS
ncbi:hypothetical protein CHEID_02245 [Corynebacterium heidelbergense]|nr:hypothetical protein CHEID_02245 [Corynebacterium heidelbergense]